MNSLQNELESIFLAIKQKVTFSVDYDNDQNYKRCLLDILVISSFSKCVEFNIEANRKRQNPEVEYLLVGNLRSICEELIWLTYLSRIDSALSTQIVEYLIDKNVIDGLEAQSKFFAANNPFQPILNSKLFNKSIRDVERKEKELIETLNSVNALNGRFPSVRNLANEIGLTSTYEFIYFSSSNFVHFNPLNLLRTGWKADDSPFEFSIRSLNLYCKMFSCFYGAIMFIGFESSFGLKFFDNVLESEARSLVNLIENVSRWPEIVTFEEMNIPMPNNIILNAFGHVMREEDSSIPYGEVLKELRSLRQQID